MVNQMDQYEYVSKRSMCFEKGKEGEPSLPKEEEFQQLQESTNISEVGKEFFPPLDQEKEIGPVKSMGFLFLLFFLSSYLCFNRLCQRFS